MGVSMRDGVRLAIEEVNKSGGVLGRQLVAVERDDEAKNERGVQIAQELINKEQVTATVGYINTGVALASQRFYQDAKIPVFNNVATGSVITHQFKAPEYPNNYVFRNAAHDSIQAPMIVEEAITRRGYKKVAILADSTNYGQLGREDLEKALQAKGIKPVAVEKFNIKDVDMTAQLLKAKAAGAEAVLTYGIGPELAQIANGMAKLGLEGADRRQLDAGDGELHRQLRHQRRRRAHAADLHPGSGHPQAQGVHRRLPGQVQAQERPHRFRRVGGPGL